MTSPFFICRTAQPHVTHRTMWDNITRSLMVLIKVGVHRNKGRSQQLCPQHILAGSEQGSAFPGLSPPPTEPRFVSGPSDPPSGTGDQRWGPRAHPSLGSVASAPPPTYSTILRPFYSAKSWTRNNAFTVSAGPCFGRIQKNYWICKWHANEHF